MSPIEDPKILQHVITLAFFAIGALLSVVGWFLRKDYTRIEDQLKEERLTRERELSNERTACAKDKHDLRDELGKESLARHALEVRIASEYVSHPALERALAPLTEAIAGLRTTTTSIFNKLDGKADKRGGD